MLERQEALDIIFSYSIYAKTICGSMESALALARWFVDKSRYSEYNAALLVTSAAKALANLYASALEFQETTREVLKVTEQFEGTPSCMQLVTPYMQDVENNLAILLRSDVPSLQAIETDDTQGLGYQIATILGSSQKDLTRVTNGVLAFIERLTDNEFYF